jgi:hypothetical protein
VETPLLELWDFRNRTYFECDGSMAGRLGCTPDNACCARAQTNDLAKQPSRKCKTTGCSLYRLWSLEWGFDLVLGHLHDRIVSALVEVPDLGSELMTTASTL